MGEITYEWGMFKRWEAQVPVSLAAGFKVFVGYFESARDMLKPPNLFLVARTINENTWKLNLMDLKGKPTGNHGFYMFLHVFTCFYMFLPPI